MAKGTKVTTVNVGDRSGLDANTQYIHFEGDNSVFFWRTSGNVLNPECQIIVPPTHHAIYIKDGCLQDTLNPGKYPVFNVEKKGFFHRPKVDAVDVDIIFINHTVKFLVEWGTREPIVYRDPITETVVHVRGGGQFEVKIADPMKFYLEIIGSDKIYSIESLKERIDVRLMSYFGAALQKVIHEKVFSYLDIPMYMNSLGEDILPILNKLMVEEVGLTLCTFTVERLGIQPDEAEAIEAELKRKNIELREKREAKEIAAELERLADKSYARNQDEAERKWQHDLLLKQLEYADKDKYYQVLKILAEHSGNVTNINVPNASVVKTGLFCPNCGKAYNAGDKFCVGCGNMLPAGKMHCPECGRELEAGSKFCPNCGHRM